MNTQNNCRTGLIQNMNERDIISLKGMYKQLFQLKAQLEYSDIPKENNINRISPWIGEATEFSGKSKVIQLVNENEKLYYEQFEVELMSNIMVDHPDNLFIRYLKARKYDVSLAFKMLYECVTFLYFKEFREIVRAGERELLQLPLESGLFYFHGHDLEGNTILYINPRFHNPKETPIDEFSKVLLYIIAQGYLIIGDKKVTVVVDLKGLSLSNVEYASVKFLSDILAYYFPEVLRRVFIVNAPWIFSGIWSIISTFLDPVIKDKILFKSSRDLLKFISKDQLPVKLGGTNLDEYEYKMPALDEVMLKPQDASYYNLKRERKNLSSDFLKLTQDWINGEQVELERDMVAQKLSDNFRALAPYTWRPSYYHRKGYISNFGDLYF